MQRSLNITRRQIVSYPLITTLNGLALKVGAEGIHEIIVQYKANAPIETWLLPFIFFVTIFRFLIGNILHMRAIEEYQKTPSIIWFYDLIIVTVESMLFVLMAYFIYDNFQYFLPILLILCFLDALWILSMIPHWRKGLRPPELPWAWGMINLLLGIYLVVALVNKLPFEPTSGNGLVITFFVFAIAAAIDIYLDYYKVLRDQPSETL